MPSNLDFLISHGFLGKSPRVLMKLEYHRCYFSKLYKRKSYLRREMKSNLCYLASTHSRIRIRSSFKSTWLVLNFRCWNWEFSPLISEKVLKLGIILKTLKSQITQKIWTEIKHRHWKAGWWTCNITRYKCH